MSPGFLFVTPRMYFCYPWCNLMCMESLQMIKPMVVGFCSIRG